MKTTPLAQTDSTVTLESQLSPADRAQLRQEALKALPAIGRIQDPKAQQQALLRYAMDRTVHSYLARHPGELRLKPKHQLKAQSASGLTFLSTLTLYPEVSLAPDYAVRIEAPPVAATTEAQIRNSLEALQLDHSQIQAADRAAAWGDLVVLDLYQRCQGQIVPQSVQNELVLALRPEAGDWLAKGMIGLRPGERRVIETRMPADHPHAPWRGQPAQCHVKLHVVAEVQVARLDDGLARALGFAGLEPLLAQVAAELGSANQQRWQLQVRDQAIQAYVDRCRVDLPEEWLNQELQQAYASQDGELLRLQGLDEAELEAAKASWQSLPYLREIKAKILTSLLVLRAVIAREGLKVSAAELDEALEHLSQAAGLGQNEQRERMTKDRTILLLAERLLMEKVSVFLFQHATVTHAGEVLIPARA